MSIDAEDPPRSACMSRRAFCATTGVGLISVGLVACTPASELADLGNTAPPDLAGAQTGSCSTGVNCGVAANIAVGAANHFTDGQNYDLFVCRDATGLYALSASCTHSGCTVQKQAARFYCPCHRATFDLNGQHPTSPARSPLEHYALCIDDAGNAIVDYNTVVSVSTRI